MPRNSGSTRTDATRQRSKSTKAPTKKAAPRKPRPPKPEDHPNYQKDLPEGFLQNTNPNQSQTY